MSTRESFKIKARSVLSKQWKMLVPIYLLFMVVPVIFGQRRGLTWLPTAVSMVGAYFFIKASFMALMAETELKLTDVISKFDFDEFVRFILAQLLMFGYLILWTLIPFMGLVKSMSYAMTPYLVFDNPTMKTNALITRSREMMDGNKMDFFVLGLSFILWILGVFFTAGLLSLYVMPYIQLTSVLFYLGITQENKETV